MPLIKINSPEPVLTKIPEPGGVLVYANKINIFENYEPNKNLILALNMFDPSYSVHKVFGSYSSNWSSQGQAGLYLIDQTGSIIYPNCKYFTSYLSAITGNPSQSFSSIASASVPLIEVDSNSSFEMTVANANDSSRKTLIHYRLLHGSAGLVGVRDTFITVDACNVVGFAISGVNSTFEEYVDITSVGYYKSNPQDLFV